MSDSDPRSLPAGRQVEESLWQRDPSAPPSGLHSGWQHTLFL